MFGLTTGDRMIKFIKYFLRNYIFPIKNCTFLEV